MLKLSLYAVAMITSLSLSGCGSDSESPTPDSLAPGGNDEGGGSQGNNGASPTATTGDLVYDYTLRKLGGRHLYRSDLTTSNRHEFARDEHAGTNLYVGGIYADDIYAPSVVSAGENHIRISSRINGATKTLPHPRASGPDKAVPCELRAGASSDGSTGIVSVLMDESVDTCVNGYNRLVDNWVYHYTPDGGEWWRADGRIQENNMFFTPSGELDFVTAYNAELGRLTIYSPSGTLLRTIENRDPAGEIEVIPVKNGGVNRDDSYLIVIAEDSVYVVTRGLLIESGLSGASTVLEGLSRANSSITAPYTYNGSDVVIKSGNDLYIVDGIRRSARKFADVSTYSDDGYDVEAAFVQNGTAYLTMENYGGETETGYWGTEMLLSSNLSSNSLVPAKLVESRGRLARAFGDGVMFFNYITEAGTHEALIVRDSETTTVSGGHHYYGSAVNLELGGQETLTFKLTSDEGSAQAGLIAPSIWSVNAVTGSALELVGVVSKDCQFIDGFTSVGEHLNVFTLCEDTYGFESLNLGTGMLRYESRDFRTIW